MYWLFPDLSCNIILQNPNWQEAQKILKLCVTRSSTLAAAPPSMNMTPLIDTSPIGLSAHTSFAEAEISFKKELPGMSIIRVKQIEEINLDFLLFTKYKDFS